MKESAPGNHHQELRLKIIKYWLTEGCGPIFVKRILLEFKFDFQIGRFANNPSLEEFDAFAKRLFKGQSFVGQARLDQELALAEKHKITLLTIIDPSYPEDLRNIYAPPAVLCLSGDLGILKSEFRLAIVGARKATRYAFSAIDRVLPGLLAQSITTVSGGALGVDTFVHQRTHSLGGQTIVVLGSGILAPYPASNAQFFKTLANELGLIVSPFLLEQAPAKHNFPIRNRIIAGLSRGCVVVQAALKSGALITSSFALAEGREVFAIPGPIDGPEFEGSNNLLAQGATLVQRTEDILEQLGWSAKVDEQLITTNPLPEWAVCSGEIKEKSLECKATPQDSILSLLEKGPMELEVLAQLLSQDYSQVEERLFELELSGQVKQRFDGLWEAAGK